MLKKKGATVKPPLNKKEKPETAPAKSRASSTKKNIRKTEKFCRFEPLLNIRKVLIK